MIAKLEHRKNKIAEEIRAVFQASYAIEAELLKAVDFPPLKRALTEFLDSDNDFYGYLNNNIIVAVIEIQNENASTHIQSMVVHPNYFRMGIAKRLVKFVFDSYDSEIFTVETGLANEPAIRLYKSFNFKETKQWDTSHGIRKVKFEFKKWA